jgi:hypothetical protein
MHKGDQRQGGHEGHQHSVGATRTEQGARPAPGKVTRTSKLAGGQGAPVQRKEQGAAGGAATPRRTAWQQTTDPWMDAAHRGAQALVQAKSDSSVEGVDNNDDDALERDADEMGARAARGESAGGAGGARSTAAAGEGSVQRKPISGNGHVVQMDGGFLDTMWRGAGIYLGITLQDEGSPYAKALMRHYVLGGGGVFNPQESSINFPTDAMWSSFMAGRPEIQRGMDTAFRTQAATVAGGSDTSGHISTSITGVSLNELESMRWTLHGCHRIEIEMDYSVSDDGSGNKTVTFTNMQFRWIDRGDMHPGTMTETDSGELVDDADLMGAGSAYPIDIPFAAPGSSVWQVSGGAATQSSGWPSAGTATSTRNRGN